MALPMALLPLRAVNAALNEPVISGSLLFILTRAPDHIRERLLRPFRNNLLAKNGASRTTILATILAICFARGVVRRINNALDRFALNGYAIKRQGEPFEFGPAKKELVVITGGSSGFGYEMVKKFSKVAKVIAFDVNPFPRELEKLPEVYFYNLDITDFAKVKEVCSEVRSTHGDPSVLINNAGLGLKNPVLDGSNEYTEKLFKVNIISHFALIREFIPGMLRMRKGHLVTVSSMAAFGMGENLIEYSCTKIGVLYLTEGIRAELLRDYANGGSICMTSVHPAWYSTAMVRPLEEELAKKGIIPGRPVEVSDRVVEQVLKERSGRIVVPKSAEKWVGLRTYPVWLQDLAMGAGWNKKK